MGELYPFQKVLHAQKWKLMVAIKRNWYYYDVGVPVVLHYFILKRDGKSIEMLLADDIISKYAKPITKVVHIYRLYRNALLSKFASHGELYRWKTDVLCKCLVIW